MKFSELLIVVCFSMIGLLLGSWFDLVAGMAFTIGVLGGVLLVYANRKAMPDSFTDPDVGRSDGGKR